MNTTESQLPAPVLVELTRGGIAEVYHRGHVCVVSNAGELLYCKGDPEYMAFLRSSAKPFQATAVVLSGAADRFGVTEQELAIIAGSHGGEPIHTETVTRLLGRGGFDLTYLQCGIHPPLDEETKNNLLKSGSSPTPLHHNCSGKHAGMLLTALHLGSPPEIYLNPDQPGQRLVTKVIAETAGLEEREIIIGIDGCSAPVHAVPVKGIARLFAQLVKPAGLDKELSEALIRVGKAMRAWPEMVAATRGRICTELMKVGQSQQITGKAGAEGVYGVGWFDEAGNRALGMGLKMEDGQQRGRDLVTLTVLQNFGVLPEELPASLKSMRAATLTNWQGLAVGETIVRV